MVREIGITVLRAVVVRHGDLPVSRGGKWKTTLQGLAIGLYVLPLDLGPWPAVVMGLAVAVTVVTGIDYVVQAVALRRASDRTARKRGRWRERRCPRRRRRAPPRRHRQQQRRLAGGAAGRRRACRSCTRRWSATTSSAWPPRCGARWTTPTWSWSPEVWGPPSTTSPATRSRWWPGYRRTARPSSSSSCGRTSPPSGTRCPRRCCVRPTSRGAPARSTTPWGRPTACAWRSAADWSSPCPDLRTRCGRSPRPCCPSSPRGRARCCTPVR